MFQYEILYEYYDYFFTKTHIVAFYFVKANSLEEAKSKAYWALGSCIEIKSIQIFN